MKEAQLDEVDIVVTWVDDSDSAWREDRNRYLSDPRLTREGAFDSRFRDWGALRFWFRALEENCPWVNRVHLVTVNPVPDWLQQSHPKLSVVHHRDFIPEEYLPTFNSRVIETHLWRIEGLAERFVYFNDDIYPLGTVPKSHFFRKGRPAGIPIMNALSVGDNLSHAMMNNIRVVNEHFSKPAVLLKNPAAWFHPRNGRGLLQNFALLPWKRFTGFHNQHLPLALTRSVCREVWEAAEDEFLLTAESRFRQFHDLNPYIFSYWQLCKGDFFPVAPGKYGKRMSLVENSVREIHRAIRSPKAALVCINDGEVNDYQAYAEAMEEAFLARFPQKSSFER